MSARTAYLTLFLSGLSVACSSPPPASPTTSGSGGTTTGGTAPSSVSTLSLLTQNGSCNDFPTQVAVDSADNLYVINGTLNQVLLDGGLSNILPGITEIVALAASSAGLFISEGSPVSIYTYASFNQNYLTGGSPGCMDAPNSDGGVGFAWGRAIAADNNENIYVADWNGAGCTRIRRISGLAGATVTISGTGNQGYVNGPGISAAFHEPSGIAVDLNKNVYVSDSANERIRMIAPDGTTTTIAGNGNAGFDDGSGPPDSPTSATFNFPTGLTVDALGNIYVADTNNNAIRMITPDGGTTTIAGNGTPGFVNGTLGKNGTTEFNLPLSVAVDHKGNLYVADHTNCAIRMIKLPTAP